MNKKSLFYPSAIEWMWNYCIPLGPFVDSAGNKFDLGVYVYIDGDVSAAIVHGDTAGDYYSGDLDDFGWSNDVHAEVYKETRKRATYLGLYQSLRSK